MTHTDLVPAWIDLRGDADALRQSLGLSARQILDFAADPEVQHDLDQWEDLCGRQTRLKALDCMNAAADALRKSLDQLEDPIELRRAASELARLARAMHSKPRPAPADPDPEDQPDAEPEPDSEPDAESVPEPDPEPDPLPRPDPDPEPDPVKLAERLADALVACGDDPEQLRVIHRQFAPGAMIMEHPALQDPLDFVESSASVWFSSISHHGPVTPFGPAPDPQQPPGAVPLAAAFRVLMHRPSITNLTIELHLAREAQSEPWLLTTIKQPYLAW